MMARIFSLMALLLLAGPCLGSGKKQLFLISFHEEGDKIEGERKVKEYEINGAKRYFRMMPVITQRNFKAYWAFPAADGKSWGAVFWLDTSGSHVLQRLGAGNRGQYLAAAVDRIPADLVMIDNVPNDSRIVIWKNLSSELFTKIDKEKKIRRIGDQATPETLARKAAELPPAPAAAAGGLPADFPLPEGAVVGDIDPATLRDATSDLAPSRQKPAARKPATPAAPVDAPFGPDDSLEKPNIAPLPTPSRR